MPTLTASYWQLRGRCLCADPRECFHGKCDLTHRLRGGEVRLLNRLQFMRLFEPDAVQEVPLRT